MWNSNALIPPAANTIVIKSHSLDINVLKRVAKDSANVMKTVKILETEHKLLCRCIYRIKLQFRGHKSLKLMTILNKSLRTCVYFQMDKDISSFFKSIPDKFEINSHFPSRQMLDYLLVRMQGYSKLLCRIVEYASTIGEYMNSRLKLGHFSALTLFILCMVSRIWQVSKALVGNVCSWYNSLLPMRKTLKICGIPWLPEDYVLPEDLFEWLQDDWLFDDPFVLTKLEIELPVFTLLDDAEDNEVQFMYEYKLSDLLVIDDDGDDKSKDIEFVKKYRDYGIINITDDKSDTETFTNGEHTESNSQSMPQSSTDFVHMTEDVGVNVSRDTLKAKSVEIIDLDDSIVDLLCSNDSIPIGSPNEKQENLQKTTVLSKTPKKQKQLNTYTSKVKKKKKRKQPNNTDDNTIEISSEGDTFNNKVKKLKRIDTSQNSSIIFNTTKTKVKTKKKLKASNNSASSSAVEISSDDDNLNNNQKLNTAKMLFKKIWKKLNSSEDSSVLDTTSDDSGKEKKKAVQVLTSKKSNFLESPPKKKIKNKKKLSKLKNKGEKCNSMNNSSTDNSVNKKNNKLKKISTFQNSAKQKRKRRKNSIEYINLEESTSTEVMSDKSTISITGKSPKREDSVILIDDSPNNFKITPRKRKRETAEFSQDSDISVVSILDESASSTSKTSRIWTQKSVKKNVKTKKSKLSDTPM